MYKSLKVFLIIETVYFLFSLLTLLDLLCLVVLLYTESGPLGIEALGLDLLLLPDPWGPMDL